MSYRELGQNVPSSKLRVIDAPKPKAKVTSGMDRLRRLHPDLLTFSSRDWSG
jgi:hypothetical protein